MKRKQLVTILFVFLSVFSMFPKSATAAKDKDQTYRQVWDENVVVNGQETQTKEFYVTKDMKAGKAKLSLRFKHSPTLVKELSSLTVLINGVEVDSKTMKQLKNKDELEIKIPKELISEGTNKVSIKTFLKSTKDDCEYNDDINWFIIQKGSSLTFDFKRKESKYIRDLFESTYATDGSEASVPIVLPDEFDSINYLQAINLAAVAGFEHRGKGLETEIAEYRYDDLEELEQEALIVGTVDQIKKLDKKLLKDKEWEEAEKNGYIALRELDKQKHFFLITNTKEEVILLNKILSNKKILSQMKKDSYALNEKHALNDQEFNENPTFTDLGYDASTQKENITNHFDYYFSIPGKQRLGEDNKVSVAYKYPATQVGENANLLVSINGEELLTKEISADKDQDTVSFSIPEKYYHRTGFNLSFEYNLNPKKVNCLFRQDANYWVEIDHRASSLELDLKERTDYNLLSSHGFVEDQAGRLEKNIVVDDFKNIELRSLLALGEYFGKSSQGVNELSIVEAREEEEISDSEHVFIGLNSSSIIKELSDDLRVPISEEGEFVDQDIFVQNASSLTGIQIDQRNQALVISSNEKEQLNKGIRQYPKLTSEDEAVILQDKEVIFSTGQETDTNKQVGKDRKLNEDIIYSAIALAIGLLAIFFVYKKL